MIKPERLKRGDKVAIVSLSSGYAGEETVLSRFHKGCKRLEQEFGLEVKIMPHALKGLEYVYKHPEKRAQDLMDAFEDDSVKAIICTIGGDDGIRILPHVNFDTIRNHPKIFMGYSDSTAHHFMMHKAGLISYHGPCVMVEFAENDAMHEYTKDYIDKILFHPEEKTEMISSPYWTSEYLDWTIAENNKIKRTMTPETHGYELLQGTGIARGTLLGGSTGILQMVTGTEIWPEPEHWNDKILFLETAEDYPTPETLTWFLRNMAAQRILNHINGIIIGKPLDEKYYEEYKDVYKRVIGIEVGRPELPILYNINCSHTAPVCILPYGLKAEIDCGKKSFTLLEKTVE